MANANERDTTRSLGLEIALSFFFVGLNRFAILTVGDRQSRYWRRGDCVRPSRSVVVVARSRGGALLMACAPCSVLCARLVLCAPCLALCALCSTLRALAAVCTARAFCSVFFLHHYSDTRMYFFPLQIAASCWLVAVSAQVTMNAADAEALNQTLTGLGCWQSSACQTKNFSCSITGVVRCNANGSVTHL